MRIFVSEYLVGGASTGLPSSHSMRREGHAMLQSVCEDIARMPGCSVVTTLEVGMPSGLHGEVIPVTDAAHEISMFQRLLGEVDAVLVGQRRAEMERRPRRPTASKRRWPDIWRLQGGLGAAHETGRWARV